ncbi:MAG: hypothetical protein LLG04_11870, partial [Parachlamydia sp.]|nr:hypothetical protein [Parachlamydia sp.]
VDCLHGQSGMNGICLRKKILSLIVEKSKSGLKRKLMGFQTHIKSFDIARFKFKRLTTALEREA